MIFKDRSIPLKILILEAILRRLPPSHPKYQQLVDELGRRRAGYEGEKSLDFYFRSLPEQKYWVLHDLNLPDGDYNCQIDTLLLTLEFVLIIEVKNMTGKLIFDTDNEQFIQSNKENDKGYLYPIAQAERHQNYVRKLLANHKYPQVPVNYLVVLSNPYASYVITGKNTHKVRQHVCKSDVLLKRIHFFEQNYSNPLLSSKDIRNLCRRLVKMNTPPTNYLLDKYGIKKSDLLTGVQCPACHKSPLVRSNQKWLCPSCHAWSRDAHIKALKDYFLLFDTKITNRQFREFTHITSIYTASRLLRAANLQFSGSNKSRYYFPTNFPWEEQIRK